MTSILMFKYFVQNQQFVSFVVDGCYAKKAGCQGDIMNFFLAHSNVLLFDTGCVLLFFIKYGKKIPI